VAGVDSAVTRVSWVKVFGKHFCKVPGASVGALKSLISNRKIQQVTIHLLGIPIRKIWSCLTQGSLENVILWIRIRLWPFSEASKLKAGGRDPAHLLISNTISDKTIAIFQQFH
jgi:hypothetical protein